MTEQDRQTQIHYEQWLNHQNQIVTSQLKYYETEVSKLRKIRKVCMSCLSKTHGTFPFVPSATLGNNYIIGSVSPHNLDLLLFSYLHP
jgi:hypothetical protein